MKQNNNITVKELKQLILENQDLSDDQKSLLTEAKDKTYGHTDVDNLVRKIGPAIIELKNAIAQHLLHPKLQKQLQEIYYKLNSITPFGKNVENIQKDLEAAKKAAAAEKADLKTENIVVSAKNNQTLDKALDIAKKEKTDVVLTEGVRLPIDNLNEIMRSFTNRLSSMGITYRMIGPKKRGTNFEGFFNFEYKDESYTIQIVITDDDEFTLSLMHKAQVVYNKTFEPISIPVIAGKTISILKNCFANRDMQLEDEDNEVNEITDDELRYHLD